MAVIAENRPFALGTPGKGGPPKEYLTIATGTAGVPGNLLGTPASGNCIVRAAGAITASSATIAAINETVFASSITAGSTVEGHLILPGFRYEFTAHGAAYNADPAAVAATARYTKLEGGRDAKSSNFDVLTSVTTNPLFIVLAFAGEVGKWVMQGYNPQDGSTVVAGNTNTPFAGKGVAADTSPRVIVIPVPAACTFAS